MTPLLPSQALDDTLLVIHPEVKWGVFDQIGLQEELEEILHRNADIVESSQLKWVIRERVLGTGQTIYQAALG